MQDHITNFAIAAFLREMRERVEQAAGLLEAAGPCSKVGRMAEAVGLANLTDEHIHDAELLLGMVAWLVRHGDRMADDGEKAEQVDRNRHDVDVAHDTARAAETVHVFLRIARQRMERAVGVARGAEIRAATAGAAVGARMALAVEPLLYDVKTLVNAASLIHRLAACEQEKLPD